MIEIPEAESLSRQLTETVGGKRIAGVVAGLSPHKFAWYHGDAKGYDTLLRGKTIDAAVAHGGMLEIRAGHAVLLFGDGVILRFHTGDEQRPRKHQLLRIRGFYCHQCLGADVWRTVVLQGRRIP